MKKITKPFSAEHALYYENYINLVPQNESVLQQLKSNAKQIIALYKSIPENDLLYRYQTDKWSMKDILMHIIDVERVFIYRAMRFARKDKTPLPFFNENEFAIHANADSIKTNNLLKEYQTNRNASIQFLNNLTSQQYKTMGIASNCATSVRACAYIICGHELHHLAVIRERYLKE